MNNCLCNFKKIKIYQFILLTMSIIIIFTKFVSASDWQNYENQFKYDKNQIPPCEYGKDLNGLTIGFLGDSWLDYGKGKCGSVEQFFSKTINSASFINSSKGGATINGNKKRDIFKQELPGKPNILVISGGGNDLITCGNNISCLNKKLDSIILSDASSGKLKDLVLKWSTSKTKIVYIYTTELPYSPNKIKKILKTGILLKLAKRVSKLENLNPNFKSINLTDITDPNEKNLWTEDGFHFSPLAYHLISREAETFLLAAQQNSNKIKSNTSDNLIKKNKCSYAIDKNGLDEKGKPYKYRTSVGSITIKVPSDFDERHIVFDKMKGHGDQNKIKIGTNLWFNKKKELEGWIKPFTSKKAKYMTHVATDSSTFYVNKNLTDIEGSYVFPDNNPKWQNEYEFLIFNCDNG